MVTWNWRSSGGKWLLLSCHVEQSLRFANREIKALLNRCLGSNLPTPLPKSHSMDFASSAGCGLAPAGIRDALARKYGAEPLMMINSFTRRTKQAGCINASGV